MVNTRLHVPSASHHPIRISLHSSYHLKNQFFYSCRNSETLAFLPMLLALCTKFSVKTSQLNTVLKLFSETGHKHRQFVAVKSVMQNYL